jgi:DNA-binding PadR family transcriptional regulator
MNAQILALLSQQNMSGEELQRALNVRHEVLYLALVRMEALGLVSVWGRRTPQQSLWCKAVQEAEVE